MRPRVARVLVLGGSGFVGSAVLRAIAAGRDLQAVCGWHRTPPADGPWESCRCQATDPDSLASALAGVSLVVNAVLAGGAAMRRAAGLLGTQAARAGIQRIVHISSMSVYGGQTGLVGEDTPLVPQDASYAGTKVACEAILRRTSAAGSDVVILRPGLVHGPGGEQWTGRLCRLLQARRLGDLGAAGDGFCNLLYVRDLGAAAAAALRAPDAAGQAINLATPRPPRWNDVLMRLAIAIGAVPVARIGATRLALEARVLARPLQAINRVGGLLHLAPGALPDPIPPSLLRLLQQSIRLDHRKADALLRFPRTGDAAGLADSARWFCAGRTHGQG